MNLIDLAAWPVWAISAFFVGVSVVIALAGIRLTHVADRLADVTGLGEAIFGAVLLGGSTSLAGIVTSLVTAYQNHPELAISNAIGKIASDRRSVRLKKDIHSSREPTKPPGFWT